VHGGDGSSGSHLDESTGYFTVHDTLRARIARAELELERRIAEAAVQSERTGYTSRPVRLRSGRAEPDASRAPSEAARI